MPQKSHTRSHRTPRTPEHLEERCVLDVRSITGAGNNVAHPDWGSANVALLRVGPVRYADGISAPAPQGGVGRPSPRVISNTIVAQTTPERVISDRFMAAMIYGWGQFIDHDLDLTTTNSAEPFNVPVPKGDPFFDPNSTGTQVIFFNRSKSVPGTGTSTSNPRQQPNQITAFLDGSMIYGSSDAVASALRTHSGGRLKTSPGADGVTGTQDDLLPFNNTTYFTTDQLAALGMGNDAHRVPDDQLFAAGDIRANENIELTSLQTLFVREHNRLADMIHTNNPSLSDETVYQVARAVVGAEIQSVTYNQWLPTLLGANPLSAYAGYNANVNPGIATEFSTALFRLGHSMLGDDVEFLNNNGQEARDAVALNDAFFNPPLVVQNDIGPILKYLATDPSSEVDNSITDPVRNFLFGPPGAGGFDLASLNIQRGRDHGIANYNAVRVAYGLPAVTSFSQISSNPDIQAKLQSLYQNVDNIDLWVGALAEDHVPGTSTGPLVRAGLIDQFSRLRDGDRFWFERVFSDGTLTALENRSLADIISDNTPINNLQNNVFFFKLSISGTVFNDLDKDGRRDTGEGGLSGRTMRLFSVDDAGATTLVATTTTDANGNYSFDVADGLATGTAFRVREVVPAGWFRTTPNPGDITFSRGGQSAVNVNFGNARTSTGALSALSGPADSGAAGSTSGPQVADSNSNTGTGSDIAIVLSTLIASTGSSGTTASITPPRSIDVAPTGPAPTTALVTPPSGDSQSGSGTITVAQPTGTSPAAPADNLFSAFPSDPLAS